MSRDLALLDPGFANCVRKVIGRVNSSTEEYQLRVLYTLRAPDEQARLWRQSRSSEQIREAVRMLRRRGAHWIADTLTNVGPQYGRWATNALPGQSWHQHGLAADCFIVAKGRAVWDSGHIGYQKYASAAKDEGIVSGAYWRRRDAVHVQKNNSRVSDTFDWARIDEKMQTKFGTPE